MHKRRIAVLVVEDEFLVRMDIVDALENAGFKVFEAHNAAEAIDVLEVEPRVSVLFTDVDMPGDIDGLRLAALVRDRWPPIRIIITSGHRKPDKEGLPAEARFLPKPYVPSHVVAIIHHLTEQV